MSEPVIASQSNTYNETAGLVAASRDRMLMFAAVAFGVAVAVGSTSTLVYLSSTSLEENRPETAVRLKP